jgi:hypothetical protein
MWIQRLGINSFVQTIRGVFAQQIEPVKDAMLMAQVVSALELNFQNLEY